MRRAGCIARRWLAWLALIAVYLCGVGHMTLLAHATCAHGEVLHGSDVHAEVDAPAPPSSEEAIAPEAQGAHDHCEGSGVTPSLDAVGPACAPMTLLEASLLESSVRRSAGVRALTVLSQAPKSSPPT